jgi:hypothetical protein
MSEKAFPFKIGADPEFSFTAQGRAINACSLLKDIVFKGEEAGNMGYKIKKAGEIGWDGCSSTGEIRPAPAYTPGQLVDNIRQLFQAFYDRIKIIDITTESRFASVGGHIHFQLDNCLNKLLPMNPDDSLDNNSTLSERRLRVMHNRLAGFYLPVVQGDNVINLKLRKSLGYGNITDYRKEKRSDGSYSYEFRTPSAEWLTTPHIAHAMIAYLATCYNEIINHPDKHKWSEVAIANMDQGQALFTLAIGKHELFSDYFVKRIKKIIPSFEYYEEYKDDINFILNGDRVRAEKEAVKYNIINGWMKAARQPSNKLLLNNKKLEAAINTINLEETMNIISLPYNNDLNVVNFVTEIKKRAICFGWKLKHQYYFFGTRQGIRHPIVFNVSGGILRGDEQIATKLDHESILVTFERMINNFRRAINLNNLDQLSETDRRNHIIIGIPYTWRTNNNYRDFIKLIIELEKKKNAAGAFLNPELLVDDSGKPNEERGLIWQAYNNAARANTTEDLGYIHSQPNESYARVAADYNREVVDAELEAYAEEEEQNDEEESND